MPEFYSQHGEDFLLNEVFKEKPTGYYVEIGCLDGVEYSNTYFFEIKGWKGACIEAHNDFIPLLHQNRPGAQVVHCAVGAEDLESVTFYANKIGSLSTIDKSAEERWKRDYKEFFTGFEEQTVRMRTLTSIFNELKPGNIDFISLDIEGYEVEALKGLDLTKYKPRIFIIEYKDDEHRAKVEQILFPHGYKFHTTVGCNLFYGTEAADKKILTKDYGTVNLVMKNPQGDEHHHQVNLSKPGLLTKLKRKLFN